MTDCCKISTELWRQACFLHTLDTEGILCRCLELQLQCRGLLEKVVPAALVFPKHHIEVSPEKGLVNMRLTRHHLVNNQSCGQTLGKKRLCAVLLEFLLAPPFPGIRCPPFFCHPPQNRLASLSLEFLAVRIKE